MKTYGKLNSVGLWLLCCVGIGHASFSALAASVNFYAHVPADPGSNFTKYYRLSYSNDGGSVWTTQGTGSVNDGSTSSAISPGSGIWTTGWLVRLEWYDGSVG